MDLRKYEYVSKLYVYIYVRMQMFVQFERKRSGFI